jgi:hypothetical protein
MLKTILTGSQHPNVSHPCPFLFTTSTDLELTSVAGPPNAAIDTEIGAAEVYKAAVVFSHNPGGDAAPAWLANLTATVNQIAHNVAHLCHDVAYLHQKANELPILLGNSLGEVSLFWATIQTGIWVPGYMVTIAWPGPWMVNPEKCDFLMPQLSTVTHAFWINHESAVSGVCEAERVVARGLKQQANW